MTYTRIYPQYSLSLMPTHGYIHGCPYPRPAWILTRISISYSAVLQTSCQTRRDHRTINIDRGLWCYNVHGRDRQADRQTDRRGVRRAVRPASGRAICHAAIAVSSQTQLATRGRCLEHWASAMRWPTATPPPTVHFRLRMRRYRHVDRQSVSRSRGLPGCSAFRHCQQCVSVCIL